MICPYCGSSNINKIKDYNYKCNCCEMEYNHNDKEFEELRHKISAILMSKEATESNPLKCYITLEDGAIGLSDLEKHHITSIFKDYELIIWINLEYIENPQELTESISLEDLKMIYKELIKL